MTRRAAFASGQHDCKFTLNVTMKETNTTLHCCNKVLSSRTSFTNTILHKLFWLFAESLLPPRERMQAVHNRTFVQFRHKMEISLANGKGVSAVKAGGYALDHC